MTMNRRSLLKTLAAGALAVGGGTGAWAREASPARAGELGLLCRDGLGSAQVAGPFVQARGAELKVESIGPVGAAIKRLRDGETDAWDVISLNNPWARRVLYPEDLIRTLPRDVFEPAFERMLPTFKAPYKWATDESGEQLIAIPQRFGPAAFVVNTDKISRDAAEDTGWSLFNDRKLAGRYGILQADDWNVLGLFLVAGVDPFKKHSPTEMDRFKETTEQVFRNARLVGDAATLNQALVAGDIDLYLSGGVFSVSAARAAGYGQLRAITPRKGPMAGDKGGLAWIEMASLVDNRQLSPLAEGFLSYTQEPAAAHALAVADGALNPVARMGDPQCLALFSKAELDAIQWDSLEEDMARSADYDLVPDYGTVLDMLNIARRTRT